jgi:hypothetical protein
MSEETITCQVGQLWKQKGSAWPVRIEAVAASLSSGDAVITVSFGPGFLQSNPPYKMSISCLKNYYEFAGYYEGSTNAEPSRVSAQEVDPNCAFPKRGDILEDLRAFADDLPVAKRREFFDLVDRLRRTPATAPISELRLLIERAFKTVEQGQTVKAKLKPTHRQYGLADSYSEDGERLRIQVGRYDVLVAESSFDTSFSIAYREHREGCTESYGFGYALTYERARKIALTWMRKRVGKAAMEAVMNKAGEPTKRTREGD